MSSLSVKAPKEDPAITAARQQEQARADAAFVTSTQSVQDEELRRRARKLGTRTALATGGLGAPGAAGLGGSGTQATPAIDYGNLSFGGGEGFGGGPIGGGQVGFF